MSTEPEYLLATDMDGTVIPLDRRKGRRREIADFRKAIQSNRSIVLAYVTGRHRKLALEGIREHHLPLPRILVCDVGTAVYTRKGRCWVPDNQYRRKMKACLGGHTGDDLARALQDTQDVIPQEEEKQAEFKRSYYVPLPAERKKVIARVKRKLAVKGIKANLVYSVDRQKGVGLLDILPASVAKDSALYYLQRKLRIPAERIVYAGDSGNDLLAFTSGFKAIVVANTPAPVKDILRSLTRKKKKLSESLFFARHRYAKGVLEGARYFGILKK